MKTAASAGGTETSENYNTQIPSSNCWESSTEFSFSGHSLSGNQGSSTFSQIQQQKIVKYWDMNQSNLSQFIQQQQTHMPLILPRLQNDLFHCLNLRPSNIYTQQGKFMLTTLAIPFTASSLLSTQTSHWSSSSSPYQYELIFIPANISKCYVCSQSFAEKYSHPSCNMVMKHKGQRIRGVDTNGNIRYSSDFQNTYYHLNHELVLKKNPLLTEIFLSETELRPNCRKSMWSILTNHHLHSACSLWDLTFSVIFAIFGFIYHFPGMNKKI